MSSSYNQGFPSDMRNDKSSSGTQPYHMQQQQQPPAPHQGQDGPNPQEPPFFHPTTGHLGSQGVPNRGPFPFPHPQGDTHRQSFHPPLNFDRPPPHLPPPPGFHGPPPAHCRNYPPPPLPNQRYLPPRQIGPHPVGFCEVSPAPPTLIPNEQYYTPPHHQPGRQYHDPQVDNAANFDEQVRSVPPEETREIRGSSDERYRDISQHFNQERCSQNEHPKRSDKER